MQSEETEGANSELFKEGHDKALPENTYRIGLCD